MSKAQRLARGRVYDKERVRPPEERVRPPEEGPVAALKLKGICYDELVRDLRVLATRDDGWLRVIPDLDRQQVWLKWKFTRGSHERHYIMVCVEDMRVHYGLQILVRKLYDVDQGLLKPTLDRLYGTEEDQP